MRVNRRVYSTGLQGQVWQKTQVSQGNSFSNILITGNAPVRSRYETWMVPSQMTSKGTLSSWSRSCSQFGKLNRAAIFFNFSVAWHSALVQCLQEKKWYTILRSAWGRGVDVSVFLLFLCRDCCYDNKKLKISYPVKPVFSAKPAPVNLWNILGRG